MPDPVSAPASFSAALPADARTDSAAGGGAGGPRGPTAVQWKSGLAAWLGWLFDGLDMHLYTLVAAPFVAELLQVGVKDPSVGATSSWIQAAFLVGWALGGAFFGALGDRLGRSRTLVLTILCYTLFTGLSYFAWNWQQLMAFRFLAALGIGGEWAVGACLLAESWPARYRPWLAAVLQTGVNLGILLASAASFMLAGCPHRTVFLVGLAPALLVLWIRKEVPETKEWADARRQGTASIAALFAPALRGVTAAVVLVCSLGLTAHWALMFWCAQHLRQLPEVQSWSESERNQFVGAVMSLMMVGSIVGNFFAAWLSTGIGYRRTLAAMCVAYGAAVCTTYAAPWPPQVLACGLVVAGMCSGLFALFTMYIPPLFPTLLRTTGAGFCYNIGRIASAGGTLLFGLATPVADYGSALFCVGLLFFPTAAAALLLPDVAEDPASDAADSADPSPLAPTD